MLPFTPPSSNLCDSLAQALPHEAQWPEWIVLTQAEGAQMIGKLDPARPHPGGWSSGLVRSAYGEHETFCEMPVAELRWRQNIQDYTVTLFFGKGGFVTVVKSPSQNLTYFVLPGGSLTLPSLVVTLPKELPHPENSSLQTPSMQTPTEAEPESNAQKIMGTAFTHAPMPSKPQTLTHQAMILGAGIGTRILPLTDDSMGLAKPALPLGAHTTVIGQLFLQLAAHGVTHCFVNTFYEAHSVIAALDSAERQIPNVTQDALSTSWVNIPESRPTGTAGGLLALIRHPDKYPHFDPSRPILIVQGDAVTNVDFSALLNAHVQNKAKITIGCQRVSDAQVPLFGIMATNSASDDDQSGSVTLFLEKPKLAQAAHHRMASCGFYVIAPEVFPTLLDIYDERLAAAQTIAREKGLPEPTELDELDFAKHIFPKIMAKFANAQTPALWAQQMPGFWSDIGNPAQYLQILQAIELGKLSWPGLAPVGAFNLPVGQNLRLEHPVFWPGTIKRANQDGAEPSGNVLIAEPHQRF
ncbi:MAG: sugar phosphate nucleotidyltransferase [Vampirovibrionales bacterium]|nr:sugar phosphate nucleotidyltransferase [Vampirovibrionales bacterium]